MKVIDFFLMIIFSLIIACGISQNSPLNKYIGSLESIDILNKDDLKQAKKYLNTSLKLYPEDSLHINILLAMINHFDNKFKESQAILDKLINDSRFKPQEFGELYEKAFDISAVNNIYLGNSEIAREYVKEDNYYLELQNFISNIKLRDELSIMKYDSLQVLILHNKIFKGPNGVKKLKDFINVNNSINCKIIKSMVLHETDSTFLFLNDAILASPNKAEYFYQKAVLSKTWVKYQDHVLQAINQAIKLDKTQGKYYYLRASYCYYHECGNENEIQDINRAIFLDPENIDYYSLRYSINESKDNFKEALLDISTLIRLKPTSKLSYILDRAMVNYKLNNQMEHNTDYKYILESGDTAKILYFLKNKGNYLSYIKKYDLAILEYKYALELSRLKLNYQNDEFNYLISKCYRNLKEYDFALEYYGKSNKQYPYYESNLFILLNRYTEALEIINKEILKDPSNSGYYELRSICKLNLSDKQGALTDIQKAIEISGTNFPWLISQRALIYHEYKMYDLEIEDLTSAIIITKSKRIKREDDKYETLLTGYYTRRGKSYLSLNLKAEACYDFSEALNYNVNSLDVITMIKSNCK